MSQQQVTVKTQENLNQPDNGATSISALIVSGLSPNFSATATNCLQFKSFSKDLILILMMVRDDTNYLQFSFSLFNLILILISNSNNDGERWNQLSLVLFKRSDSNSNDGERAANLQQPPPKASPTPCDPTPLLAPGDSYPLCWGFDWFDRLKWSICCWQLMLILWLKLKSLMLLRVI